MIRTTYPLEIEIDDITYKVDYKAFNNKVQDELQKNKDASIKKFEKKDAKVHELNFKKEQFALNAEILKDAVKTQKVEILIEQKKIKQEIFDLEVEIEKLVKDADPLKDDIEKTNERIFDMMVTGSNATALKAVLVEKGIDYQIVLNLLGDLASKVSEKKSETSSTT